MKKTIICLITLFICSFVANAQSTSALEAYNSWKNAAFDHLGSADNVHYSLATLTQRIDDKTARIEFAVVGQIPNLDLEIRPLRIQKDINGELSRENIGDSIKASQELSLDKINPNPISDLTVKIPVDKTVNAIEVEWKFNARGKELSYKLILPLENQPSGNTLGIIPSPKSSNLIPLCRKGCYEVSGNTQSCGFL